ncbi:MAG: hypothetical protein HWD59_01085 [Coxiellaceae bacterium]|nr:MAG: hypothetical protein HWD59_01085 [Coxiellaceae bacterium]
MMHKEYYFPEVFIQLTNLERKTHSFMLEMTTHHKDLLINVYNAVFASKSSSSGNNNNNATRLNLDDDSHSIKGEVFNCNILVKQNTLRVVREMLSEVKKHPDKSLSNTVSGSSHTLINHIYSIYKNLALLSHINLQRDHKGFPVFGPVMQTLRINYENKLTTMVSHASLLFNQVLQADMANELQLPFIYALVKLISSLLELEAEPELKDKFAMTLQGQVSRCFLMLKTGAVEASKTEFLVSFCCYLMPKETMQQLNTWYNETTTLKNTEKRKYDQLKYKQDFVSKLVGHAKHELKVLARLDSIDYPTQLDTLIEKSVKAGVQNEVEALGFY